MGITVRHDPGIRNVGEMAVQIGYGQRKMRDEEFTTKTRQADRALDLRASSISASSRNAAANRAVQMAMQGNALKAQSDMAEQRHAQQLEQYEAKDRLDREKTTWEYTQLQQKEKEKIDEGRNWLEQERASGRVTQPEYEQFKGQLDAREHGILPVRKYNNEPSPQEIMAQRTWVDPETGDKIYMEPGGRIHNLTSDRNKEIETLKIKKQESYAKAYIETFKALTTEDEFGGKKLPAPEQVTAVMKAMYPNMQPAQAEQPTQESPGLTEAIEAVQQIRENPDLQTPENIGTTYAKAIKEAYPDASPEEQRSMTEEAILTDFPDLGKDSGFEKEQTVKIEQPKTKQPEQPPKPKQPDDAEKIASLLTGEKPDFSEVASSNDQRKAAEKQRRSEERAAALQRTADRKKAGLEKDIETVKARIAKRYGDLMKNETDKEKLEDLYAGYQESLASAIQKLEKSWEKRR